MFKDLISELKNNSVVNVFFEASDITVEKYNRFKKAFSENNIECVCDGSLDHKIEKSDVSRMNQKLKK